MIARPARRVAVAGASALSAFGASWRGLGAALRDATPLAGIPADPPLSPKARTARKMMSRGAHLAAAALADLMRDVAWSAAERELAGYYLGVGASAGSLDDVTALLDASIVDHAFSLPAFGDRGLAACNPLLAFQLMNNFTLAHGAILEGLGGPNGALFSRGTGTTAALVEAVHAIASGECDRAVAGGADAPTHPVTRAELAREGFVERGLVPADGAALVALVADEADPKDAIEVAGCAVARGRGRSLSAAIEDAAVRATAHTAMSRSVAVIAPWGPPARDAVTAWIDDRMTVIDTSALGATLAASPALAWVAAIDLLDNGVHERAVVIDAGVDGDVGVVVLGRGAAGGAA